MWDYLRRSGARGFFLAISGGVDSSVVASLVYCMARLVHLSCERGSKETIVALRRIVDDDKFMPKDPREIVDRIFVCAFLKGTGSTE